MRAAQSARLSSMFAVVAGSGLLPVLLSCTVSSGTGGGGQSESELGDADVYMPTDGDILLMVDELDGVGSVVYRGLDAEGDSGPMVTEFEADTGEDVFVVSLDADGWPTDVMMGSLQIVFTVNLDGSFDYEAYDGGELLCSGSDLPISDETLKTVDGVRRRVSRTDIADCVVQEVIDVSKFVINEFLGDARENPQGHPFFDCLARDEVFRAAMVMNCVIKKVLNARLQTLTERCNAPTPGSPACTRLNEITDSLQRAIQVFADLTGAVAVDAVHRLEKIPDCRGDAEPEELVCSVAQTAGLWHISWDHDCDGTEDSTETLLLNPDGTVADEAGVPWTGRGWGVRGDTILFFSWTSSIPSRSSEANLTENCSIAVDGLYMAYSDPFTGTPDISSCWIAAK